MESTSFSERCPDLAKVLSNLHESGQRKRGDVLNRKDFSFTEDRKLRIRSSDSAGDFTDIHVIDGVEQSPFGIENAVKGLLQRILKELDARLPKKYDPEAEVDSFTMPTDLDHRRITSAGVQPYEVSSDIALGLRLLCEDTHERTQEILIDNGTLYVWYR